MLQSFIHEIPKAELHLHIEGTLEPELMFKFGERNGISLPFKTIDELRNAYEFDDLKSFLDVYYAGSQVLIGEQDFYDLTWAYVKRVKDQNVHHIEMFFDPQAHTSRGINFETVISGISNALEDAEEQLGITSRLIMCFLRHLSEEKAMDTLQEAIKHKEEIMGVGLDSNEVGNPPEKFVTVFKKARSAGFLTFAHAGEVGPPEYIWQALEKLKVVRIDHGVRCMEDERLVEELIKRQVPLTVCPLSNVKLKVVYKLSEHNLKRMLDRGLCVTVNSDDPAYFGGYIEDNFLAVQKSLNLEKKDIIKLVKNSFNSTCLPEEHKQRLFGKLENFLTKHS